MKKLLTLLIMSFLVLSAYAQSRAVEDNSLRDQLAAKKSLSGLNIQSDDSVPFCHEGLEIPRECTDCGLTETTYAYIWYEGFGDYLDEFDEDSLWVDGFNTAEYYNKDATVPAWSAYDAFRSGMPSSYDYVANDQFLDHLGDANRFNTTYNWDQDGVIGYDWVIRQVIDTTTFNAYPIDYLGNPTGSKYSWWIGSNDPHYNLPGYGSHWYLALQTDSLFRIQSGLTSVTMEFDAAWAQEAGIDWIYVEARSWGSAAQANVYKATHSPASDWFVIDRQHFNDNDAAVNPGSESEEYMHHTIYLDGTAWAGDGASRDFRGEIVEFRFVFGSDKEIDNADGLVPTFGAFFLDNLTLHRNNAMELIDDGGDTKLGLSRVQLPTNHFSWWFYPEMLGTTPYEWFDSFGNSQYYPWPIMNDVYGYSTTIKDGFYWHNSTWDAVSGRSLYCGFSTFWRTHHDPTSNFNYKYPLDLGQRIPNLNEFHTPDAHEDDWPANTIHDPAVTLPNYDDATYYPNGNPYVYAEHGYDRQVYNVIKSQSINLRYKNVRADGFTYPNEESRVHNIWHPICLDFDYKFNAENIENANGNQEDWWRVWIYDPQQDKTIYDSGELYANSPMTDFDSFGEILLTKDAANNNNGIDPAEWPHNANGYATADYNVEVFYEFYGNPNPWGEAGLFIDNVRVYEKWDNGEPNETFDSAYDLDPHFVTTGNVDEFVTTCAMILAEPGGLYYDETNANGKFGRDEDFYSVTLDADEYMDVVVDNEEIDLQVQIYDEDYRLVIQDDGSASNGMPYSADYDRVIMTVDTDLPGFTPGTYYIVVIPSDNVSIDQTGRYALSVRKGRPEVDVASVDDVPQDQGLQVRVTWDASYLDTECIPVGCCNNDDGNPLQLNGIRVEKYSIWRIKGFAQNWDYVDQVLAAPDPDGMMSYAYVSPTVVDGVTHRFKIGTHMFNGEVYFGAEGSGASQDNLAPSIVLTNLQNSPDVPVGVDVDWDIDGYDDVETYEIFRNTQPCNPDVETPIATTNKFDRTYLDTDVEPGTRYYYLVRGVDKGGNPGDTDCQDVLVTGVEGEAGVPTEYSLKQNYPNPFNPSTVINFGLPVEANVTVRVFDVLGQEVAQILNSNMKAGYHKVNFDASSLMSGMYIYRIQAKGIDGSNFTDVKKMLLVK